MKTKKELKDEYKQMKFPMGIFQVKNIATNKVLVDHSLDMKSKWNRHKMELKFGNHKNRDFQKDWNKYGAENFVFEVLAELKNDEGENNVDYNLELKTLQDMVLQEFEIKDLY